VSMSLLFSVFWMKGMNGIFVAQFLVSEVGLVPAMEIPSRYLVSHALYGLGFTFCLISAGGLSWVLARMRQSPTQLMR